MNSVFRLKQFEITQNKAAMKVGTDSILLGCLVEENQYNNVLDIGAGTGITALMMAQRFGVSVTAVEIENEAAVECLENFNNSKFQAQLQLIHNDIAEYAKYCTAKFDLIISNPPFFIGSLKSNNEKRKLARHNDSLSFKVLAKCVLQLLHQDGLFYVILPEAEMKVMILCMENYALFPVSEVKIFPKMSSNCNRIVMAFSNKKRNLQSKKLVIYEQNGDYTREFKELTKAFYLTN